MDIDKFRERIARARKLAAKMPPGLEVAQLLQQLADDAEAWHNDYVAADSDALQHFYALVAIRSATTFEQAHQLAVDEIGTDVII